MRGGFNKNCGWGGRTNERPGTDHAISGLMRGLGNKLHPMALTDRQTDGHGNSMTKSAKWGQFSENIYTEVGFSLKWGFKKIRPTHGFLYSLKE